MNAEIKLKDMTEEQIADLEAQIAELRKAKERKPLAWKPTKLYFSIDNWGSIDVSYYNGYSFDDGAYEQGNMFPTKELAEAELERRKVIREIEELVDKYDTERGGAFIVGENNYTFYHNLENEKILINCFRWMIYNPLIPYFSSSEVAQRILDEVGKDRVKLLFIKYSIMRDDE